MFLADVYKTHKTYRKTSDRSPRLLPVQLSLTPGLYPGPGVYSGPGFYPRFYGKCHLSAEMLLLAYIHSYAKTFRRVSIALIELIFSAIKIRLYWNTNVSTASSSANKITIRSWRCEKRVFGRPLQSSRSRVAPDLILFKSSRGRIWPDLGLQIRPGPNVLELEA